MNHGQLSPVYLMESSESPDIIQSYLAWYNLKKPLGNLNELIAEEKGENINEINALNHLISSELFNFSSLIINQIASENKVQWVEIFSFLSFAIQRIEAWKNWLDMKHNEIHVYKRSELSWARRRENITKRNLLWTSWWKFPFVVALLKWENIVEVFRSQSVKWTFFHKSTEKFIIIFVSFCPAFFSSVMTQ